MSELDVFLDNINRINSKREGDCTIEQAQETIKAINEFLFAEYDCPEKIEAFGREFSYFSAFHKYWHDNYDKILNARICDKTCEKVADLLHNIYIESDGKAFYEIYSTEGLRKEDICRVRFLTANQDFRGSRDFKQLANIFKEDSSVFNEKRIINEPDNFLGKLKLTSLSQMEKRPKFSRKACEFLIEHDTSPYDMIECYDHDIYKLRNALISYNAGYGNKKTDMFIRDMVVLGIWKDVKGFEKIDVASDMNTIKVALRVGILKLDIPLVSSFLDMFCYQYAYIDNLNAKAWRRVWEIWREKYPRESIESPCLMDYFIYRLIGQSYCKNHYYFRCDEGHIFIAGPTTKYCKICGSSPKRTNAEKIFYGLPCDFTLDKKDKETSIIHCPFDELCNENDRKYLNPPKSISILGTTGWESAYTKPGEGGGGLMA